MACERWRARLVAHLYDESEPDEAREVVLVPDRSVDDVDGCTITAVESDRRVLLINS